MPTADQTMRLSVPPTLWTNLRRHRRSRFGLGMVVVLLLVGFAAPLLASRQPIVCRWEDSWHLPAVMDTLNRLPVVGGLLAKSAPFSHPGFDAKTALDAGDFSIWPPIPFGPLELTDGALQPPSGAHWLGTDDRGRDVAARLIHGVAVSVKVGFLSMLLAGAIGIVIGAIAGYAGGWTDKILSRFIEVVICFPTFFLILSVMVWIKADIDSVIVVIGLTQWTAIARLVRAEFLRLQSADFVAAARCSGASAGRIILRHMLPGALAPVVVTLSFGVADAVLLEAGLSWLGFGVPTPDPSWGNMLRSAYGQIRSAPHLVYPPCIAIFVSVMAYHLVGDGLREALDPKSSVRG